MDEQRKLKVQKSLTAEVEGRRKTRQGDKEMGFYSHRVCAAAERVETWKKRAAQTISQRQRVRSLSGG